MSDKPTLVLVPGAGHTIEVWNKVIPLLEAQDYKCIPVPLPSTLGNASTTFKEDIDAVRNVIISETTQGHNVVLIVHSYGGAVGQSAIKDLTLRKADPSSSPKSGHVVGLIMMASGFGITGMSFIEGLGGSPPPSWRTSPSGFAEFNVPPLSLFYHDLPEEEGNYWVSKLTKQALRPLMDKEGGEWAYAGWMDLPVWFLATVEDKALPVEAQRTMVKFARDAGGDVMLRECMSGHSPMLSRPKEVVDFVLEAVAAFGG